MSKYQALRAYLKDRKAEAVPMTFNEIEKVIGFKLPKSQIYPAWWSNNPTNNVMTNEWLAAGFKTEQVDVEGRKLVFRRMTRAAPLHGDRVVDVLDAGEARRSRRHPLFGWMKGTFMIAPGTDLTAPADPDWADIAEGKQTPGKAEHGGA